MNAKQIEKLLKDVKTGDIRIAEAVEKLRHLPFEDLGFANVDHHRQIRCGFPEVIYCPGKTTEQIIQIFEKLAARKHNVLATRAQPEVFEALSETGKFPKVRYEKDAKAIVLEQEKCKKPKGFIAVVTAGTADVPVAAEAKVTAEIMGNNVEYICDVGVAGIHRLLKTYAGLAEGKCDYRGGRNGRSTGKRSRRPCGLPGDRRSDKRRLRSEFRRSGGPTDNAQ